MANGAYAGGGGDDELDLNSMTSMLTLSRSSHGSAGDHQARSWIPRRRVHSLRDERRCEAKRCDDEALIRPMTTLAQIASCCGHRQRLVEQDYADPLQLCFETQSSMGNGILSAIVEEAKIVGPFQAQPKKKRCWTGAQPRPGETQTRSQSRSLKTINCSFA